MRKFLRKPAPWVFLILLGSYAFFWHSRDWNTASRLMLTYALGRSRHGRHHRAGRADRRQGQVPGPVLFRQAARLSAAGDAAVRSSRSWSCGFPSIRCRAGARAVLGGRLLGHALHFGPAHGLHWCTAWSTGRAAWVAGPGRAALLGLAYGLATPAYVYATLAYGHQATAFASSRRFSCSGKKPRAGGRLSCSSPASWRPMRR